MIRDKPSVVFDCMIFLQSAISKSSPAAELFRRVERGTILLFVSREILFEIRDVLSRPKTLSKYPHLTAAYIDTFISSILHKAQMIKTLSQRFNLPRDPKDEKYINLALEAEADFIITRDKDLLDLMTGIDVASKQFRQSSRPLRILEPSEFLNILASEQLPLKP